MGLTTEQWHKKRTDDIINYVLQHGEKMTEKRTIWRTYPVCVKDICVSEICVDVLSKEKRLSFGDTHKGKFVSRRTPNDLERRHLEEILEDMKAADFKKKK